MCPVNVYVLWNEKESLFELNSVKVDPVSSSRLDYIAG